MYEHAMTPEWITAYSEIGTAVGTVGAVIVALFLAGTDARRRSKQEERLQAEQISGWMVNLPRGEEVVDGEMYVKLVVQNASNQLVYSTIASIVNAQTEDHVGGNENYRAYIGRLPPGKSEYNVRHPGYGMHRRFSVELAFEDARGIVWVRRGKGSLTRIRKNPLAYYSIDPPVGWLMP
jgi:hypothetical protein